jgi:hypothetical protein
MTIEAQQRTNKPILCVDWDGVIHSYTSGWKGAAIIPDLPVPGALEWLHRASKLFEIVIYSSRSKDLEARAAMRMYLTYHARTALSQESAEALLEAVSFASDKPAAFLTIDDRALCFDGDWSKLDPEKLRDFKPWYLRGRVIKETIKDDLATQESVT